MLAKPRATYHLILLGPKPQVCPSLTMYPDEPCATLVTVMHLGDDRIDKNSFFARMKKRLHCLIYSIGSNCSVSTLPRAALNIADGLVVSKSVCDRTSLQERNIARVGLERAGR